MFVKAPHHNLPSTKSEIEGITKHTDSLRVFQQPVSGFGYFCCAIVAQGEGPGLLPSWGGDMALPCGNRDFMGRAFYRLLDRFRLSIPSCAIRVGAGGGT